MNPMSISVLIAVYKRADNLDLILKALTLQTDHQFEIVVCEDDQDPKVKKCITDWQKKSNLKIRHVSHQDDGFRKSKILNEGVRTASGEFIVFLDGDCIPHRKFIQSYKNLAKEGWAMHGRRVMLSSAITQELLTQKKSLPLSLWTLWRSKSQSLGNAIRIPGLVKKGRQSAIWGCNWGVAKKHLLSVNGFDEDYVKAGVGEDVDIEWRLQKIGVELLNVRHQAIVYHLDHAMNYSAEIIAENTLLYNKKKSIGLAYCVNGLNKTE